MRRRKWCSSESVRLLRRAPEGESATPEPGQGIDDDEHDDEHDDDRLNTKEWEKAGKGEKKREFVGSIVIFEF